jgi:hypothetical protein
MNEGAKVLEVGVPVFELERYRPVALLLGDITSARAENDWLRLWGGLWVPDSGDDIMVDLGLPLVLPGPADGEPVLENGLLRFCAEFDAISLCTIQRYQHVCIRLGTAAKGRQAIQSLGT